MQGNLSEEAQALDAAGGVFTGESDHHAAFQNTKRGEMKTETEFQP